jgi:hypothetical protein
MKRVLCLLLLLGACGGVTPPKPPPTPPPTPPPPQMKPLAVQGNQFVPPILGSITTHHNWPLLDPDALDKIAAAGLNYTDFRLPFSADDRPGYEAYMRTSAMSPWRWTRTSTWDKTEPPDQKLRVPASLARVAHRGIKLPAVAPVFDLTRFNPAFWKLLHDRAAYAQAKGIYVLVDLVDGWWLKHSELPHYWHAGNNTQGVNLGYCTDAMAAPQPTHEAWLRHVVDSVGDLPNVIWQDGNELNFCNPTESWVLGLKAIVRDEESKRGFIHHLFGSLSENPTIDAQVDFASFHKDQPVAARAYPIQVNEFFPQAQAVYLNNLQTARSAGTVYHYWHDDNPGGGAWDDPAWEAEWTNTMAKMGKPTPPLPCTFPCPAGPECSVLEICRNCTPPIGGDKGPSWVGDVDQAVRVVQDARPELFQGQHLINGNAPEPLGNATRQAFFLMVVAQLSRQGVCAVAREDAVEVSKDSVNDEEYHLIFQRTGDIIGAINAFKTRSHRP